MEPRDSRRASKRPAAADTHDRLSPDIGGRPDIGRRGFLRVLGAGAGAAAASAAPLAAAPTETATTAKKRRARYQANSKEVQTFYRVNRYPAK